MNYLQNFIIGIVSGFAELLPIPAETHRAVLRCLFGIESEDALSRLIFHLASLTALVWCSREELIRVRKAQSLARIPPKKRRRQPDMPTVYTIRLLRSAGVFLILGRLFTTKTTYIGNELQILAFSTLSNGVLLFLPSFMRSGNKDSRNMPRLDGLLMGIGAGLSVIPGFSQVGTTVSIGCARGVDRKYALKFAYLLLVPGLLIHVLFDIIAIVSAGGATFSLVPALVSFIACCAGSCLGYKFMKFLVFSTNFTVFSYYCFGAGLFSFVLFLTI